ncbi:DUF7848 domain-containing protein [Actinacidiphila soli]|uniref:DUF7848 domain-containing protein n=1 Tax=Actinacidiphila soli TaxID=2487275 RepID=UPI000FCB611A|nr:hypothetical protein [Actinacidiphila soli]
MSAHVIIRAAEWILGQETSEGAPQAIFVVVCMTCAEESQPVDDERLPVEVWALKHTGLNPSGDGAGSEIYLWKIP